MRVPLPRLPNALRPKRRWFQYTLRTLLLLMTACAVWMGRYVHRARLQKRSVAAIREYGGWVRYDFQFNYFTDEGMRHASRAPRLEELWVCGREVRENPITDEGLAHLQKLQRLKELGIQHTQVTAEGIQAFTSALPACRIAHRAISDIVSRCPRRH